VRRALKVAGIGVGALIGALLVVAILLLATNPQPQDSPGWERRAEMLIPRGEAAYTIFSPDDGDPVLVVAGGFARPAVTSDRVSIYDPRADVWDEAPRLPASRHHAGLAPIPEGVVLTGGAESALNWTPRGNVWLLRDGSDVWEGLEPMPEGRHSHQTVNVDGRLYVVGGHGDTADVLIWDRHEGWSRGAALPVPRHHLRVVVLDGEIWALGGRDGDENVLDDVHVYDPETDQWREGPRLPVPVSAGVEGVIDGTIHHVGGEDPAVPGGWVTDHHLVLSPGAGQWQSAPASPLPHHGAVGGVIDGRLIVAGGSRRQGMLSPLAWSAVTAVFDPEESR
jgi:hypothetical protein